MSRQRIAVLGATGSVGHSTLDVLERHPERFEVAALTANTRVAELAALCRRHRPRLAVMCDAGAAAELRAELAGLDIEVLAGRDGLIRAASDEQIDTVMAAIVGAAGLESSLAAADSGKKLLLANKESLVMAGGLFMRAVRRGGGELLPIDSEHNAIFQSLPGGYRTGDAPRGIRRILLTASGGPFLHRAADTLATVTPDEAVAHPNWSMGRKISVDSATLMNKGLELIEACLLFDVTPDRVDVVVHPQSIVHSMVEYLDGSVLAQLGSPDMRTPIASALSWPDRIEAGVGSLDLIGGPDLQFFAPDLERFPCLALAMEAARGDGGPVVLNGANEVAVEAFLAGRLRFDRIPEVIAAALTRVERFEPEDLAAVQTLDARARDCARQLIEAY